MPHTLPVSPKSNVKVLIADDHGLFRMGLGLLLRDRLGVSEVIEVDGFDAALDRLAKSADVTLALFDLSMPGMGGPESLAVLRETYPGVRIAIVSGSEDRDNVLKAVSIGLDGYVPKSLPEDEIVKALRMILDGHVFVPRVMTATASAQPARSGPAAPAAAPSPPVPAEIGLDDLTPRQRDVLEGISRGLSNKEIARQLDLAEGTVKIHLAALFARFGARNRTELATRAQDLGR
ncbi:MAG: response regulator [Hyphomicrobiaceae bacterium]